MSWIELLFLPWLCSGLALIFPGIPNRWTAISPQRKMSPGESEVELQSISVSWFVFWAFFFACVAWQIWVCFPSLSLSCDDVVIDFNGLRL